MEVLKKPKSISKVFAKYMFLFSIVTIIFMILSFYLFSILLIESGSILPANYYQVQIEKHKNEISQAENVRDIIPNGCGYAVYDFQGNLLQGNVSEDKSQKMWNVVVNNKENNDGVFYYQAIQRSDGVCIVEYTLIARFANPIVDKYIPSAEFVPILIFICLFFIEIFIFSTLFKSKMTREMQILKDTTENIRTENLDFEVTYSNIIEINEILFALDKMKNRLSDSLEREWKMEQVRKEQIAALAHDIKTPLTIVKGNSELLNELDLNSIQKEFNSGILSAVDNIEGYTKLLMDIINSEKQIEIHKNEIDLKKFLRDVIEEGKSISINKNINFSSSAKNTPELILADESALKRAISNVISNSVEYTDRNGEILFRIDADDENVKFIIEDSGRGFSKEELKSATEQFYQGDKSRSLKNHYGMGLYIVRKFMEQHNGEVQLGNSEKLGGAKVILQFPKIIS